MHSPEILVVDDELQMQKLLAVSLRASGFRTREAASGKEGLAEAAKINPDLILLDLALPDRSGHEILSNLREWFNSPVIVLSVLNDEENIVRALNGGANDYLVKPFRMAELIARIRSALRNVQSGESQPAISFGRFEIDFSSRRARVGNETLKLTSTQFSLLALFAKNEGKVLTHQYILKEVWGDEVHDQLQYLRVFVAQLRKKLEAGSGKASMILTEQGIGYRFRGI